MSLEDAISKLAHEIALNTAAVKENTLVRNGGVPNMGIPSAAGITLNKEGKVVDMGAGGSDEREEARLCAAEVHAEIKAGEVIQKAKKSTHVKTEETVLSGNGASPQSEPETVAVETLAAISYEKDIMPVLVKFFTKCGKDKASALLVKWNVTKFSQVPTGKLGGLLADLNSGLGA